MKEYLRWSLHQLFLLYFQPSRFQREVEGFLSNQPKLSKRSRYHYMFKMLPWIIVFGVVGNLLIGFLCEMCGVHYRWFRSWEGVAWGVAMDMWLGVVAGVAWAMMVGVTLSIGIAFLVAGEVAGITVFGVAFGMIVGAVTGIAHGENDTRGMELNLAASMLWGGMFGLMLGMDTGLKVAMMFSVGFALTYYRLYAYPLDVFLSGFAWALRERQQGVRRSWQLCPVSWNEIIYLPLPYAARLLTLLTQKDREEGFRQIAFVASERKLQRRVALVALQEVALGDLRANALPDVLRVAEKLEWTTNAPMELPAALQTALPRFGRIAELVGQYGLLHNAYRKQEALQRAREELEALQKSLIVSRERYAVQLLQAANQWAALLEAEWKTVATLSAAQEIPNPFRFGNPVQETEQNVFTGRRDIAAQIESSILNSVQAPTLLLHGARRMGKTSLLNQLPRLLGPDFAPAAVDCQNAAVTESQAAMLRYLSRSVSDGLHRRRVTLEPLSASQLEREPFGVFDEWLTEAERRLPDRMRVLLCLDEYERLQETLDAGWGGKFLDMLRNTLQHRSRVVMLFTGVRSFAELGPAWTDRFLSTRRIRVSFLTAAEVEPLLTRPIPEFYMTYADGALEALIRETHGQPFLTQAVAYELVQYLNEHQRREASEADIEVAIGRALESGDAYFANVWSDAREEGQAILRAVAGGETPPHAPQQFTWLREHDVLDANGAFLVPMVQRWVRTEIERGQ